MATRFAIDVGGTFTDIMYYDEQAREIRIGKALSRHDDLAVGVSDALSGLVSAEGLAGSRYFLHGTTVGLNALLERRGPRLGLLATSGFRDVLEIRAGDREEMVNLFWQPPWGLVPRYRRLEVRGRTGADGSILTPLASEDVLTAAETFRNDGVDCVAIAFINSYRNPAQEQEAERLLREAGYTGDLSLSSALSREYREYERTCTTVVDAYVRPRMRAYLGALAERLRDGGFVGSSLIMRSGGGTMTFAAAARRPVETLLSGPVGGAQGAGKLALALELGDVVTADVGGTSFDTALIREGVPETLSQGEIVGLPIQTSWVDVRSIGAGGGSIAHVDSGGLLRVGPRSAGSAPGPACYGRGGTEPTVTDAAVVLGMLGPTLSGGLELDRDAAERALELLQKPLGLDRLQVAEGIVRIAAAGMANAIREITVERGQDPRGVSMVAFGGAGPMLAWVLADELQIPVVAVPPCAGNFSAWGLLTADLVDVASQTHHAKVDARGVAELNGVATRLRDVLIERGESAGNELSQSWETSLDVRYVGQEHVLTIPAAVGRAAIVATDVQTTFERRYGAIFGQTLDEPLEAVSVRILCRTLLPAVHATGEARADASCGFTRPAFSFRRGAVVDFAVLDRDGLAGGASVRGPALIVESTTSTYLDDGCIARVDPTTLTLILMKDGAGR